MAGVATLVQSIFKVERESSELCLQVQEISVVDFVQVEVFVLLEQNCVGLRVEMDLYVLVRHLVKADYFRSSYI